jgi:PX domain
MYISYIIAVDMKQTGQTTEPIIKSWTVDRRFRRFLSLHDELSSHYKKDELPSLPKRSFRRSFDPEYIEGKRVALETYLQKLMEHPIIGSSSRLCSFLVGRFSDVGIPSAFISRLRDAEQASVKSKQLADTLQVRLVDANDQRSAAVAQLSGVSKRRDELTQKTNTQSALIQQMEQRIAAMEAAYGKLQSEAEASASAAVAMEQQITSSLKRETERANKAEERARNLQAQFDTISADNSKALRALQKLQAKNTKLSTQNSKLKTVVKQIYETGQLPPSNTLSRQDSTDSNSAEVLSSDLDTSVSASSPVQVQPRAVVPPGTSPSADMFVRPVVFGHSPPTNSYTQEHPGSSAQTPQSDLHGAWVPASEVAQQQQQVQVQVQTRSRPVSQAPVPSTPDQVPVQRRQERSPAPAYFMTPTGAIAAPGVVGRRNSRSRRTPSSESHDSNR